MENIFIGRQEQIAQLEDALQSNKPEMLALVGRRRVGKTYLVRQVYADRISFELTGLQDGSREDQLQNFVFALGKYFPDFQISTRPATWLEAFHILTKALERMDKKEKTVVFLDEVPWLATQRSGFLTGLGSFWNSWASQQNMVVVICGSAASWMIKKVINDRGGLHNRVTKMVYLYPFTLAETEAYCKARNIKLNRYHILQLYMAMGGIPMYLDQLKPGLSAVQNIQSVCFAETGYLRHEFGRLFASLFQSHERHVAIVRALASKRSGVSRSEIIGLTKFANSGMLTDILEELHTSEFITIYNSFGKKNRDSLYHLSDPYSLFFLTFLEPLGKSSQMDFIQLSDLPKWKTWSGYAFENVCLTHVRQIRKALGISGVASSISTFYARPKDGFPGAQIDLLIDRNDQTINICEMKFSTSDFEVTKKDVESLENKKRVLQYHSKTKKHLFATLVTTMGIIENSNRLNHIDQVVVLDDLFEL